jgi:hypothetical protein
MPRWQAFNAPKQRNNYETEAKADQAIPKQPFFQVTPFTAEIKRRAAFTAQPI